MKQLAEALSQVAGAATHALHHGWGICLEMLGKRKTTVTRIER